MNNDAVIADAREKLAQALGLFVRPGEPYALLDFPNHWNVGDSAIWAGEERLLRDLASAGPAYVSTTDNFDAESCRRHIRGGTVFLHGGGNFGDIYQRHQAFRQHVLTTFRDHRVVMLPQTIKYHDPALAAPAADAIAAHPDVHLFVRDQASVEFARDRLGCAAVLVPDSAFALGPLRRTRTPAHQLLLHLRRDVERVERDLSAFDRVPDRWQSDWIKEGRARRVAVAVAAEAGAVARGRASAVDRRLARYHALARMRLARGLTLLSSARQVVTDRLHGHILCTLLSVPHVALDNDYGKVHAYIDAWTAGLDSVRRAHSAAEAVELLPTLPV